MSKTAKQIHFQSTQIFFSVSLSTVFMFKLQTIFIFLFAVQICKLNARRKVFMKEISCQTQCRAFTEQNLQSPLQGRVKNGHSSLTVADESSSCIISWVCYLCYIVGFT